MKFFEWVAEYWPATVAIIFTVIAIVFGFIGIWTGDERALNSMILSGFTAFVFGLVEVIRSA